MTPRPRTRRESDLDDLGRCECADQSHAVQGSVAAEENTAGRRTDSWLLTWLSGSVAEAGWTGGSAQAAVGVSLRLAHASEVVVDVARRHTPSMPPLVSRMGYVERTWDGLFWAAWNSS